LHYVVRELERWVVLVAWVVLQKDHKLRLEPLYLLKPGLIETEFVVPIEHCRGHERSVTDFLTSYQTFASFVVVPTLLVVLLQVISDVEELEMATREVLEGVPLELVFAGAYHPY
jgi:hypothetical protein